MGSTGGVAVEQRNSRESGAERERSHHLITLSAATEQDVQQAVINLGRHLQRHPQQSLADIAYTYHIGRRAFDHRLAITVRDRAELQAICQELSARPSGSGEPLAGASLRSDARVRHNKVAFLYTGFSSQRTGMGRELYHTSDVFRQTVDDCAELLQGSFPEDIRTYLFEAEYADKLNQFDIGGLATFVLQMGLTRLWESWGIRPDYVIGHSMGEYAAACVAGALPLREMMQLLIQRTRLMQYETERGAMLSILSPLEQVEAWIQPYAGRVSIATINGPQQIVVSGYEPEVEDLAARLTADGVINKRISSTVAPHSALLDPILESYRTCVAAYEFQPLAIPLVSNLYGDVLEGQVLDATYWVRHLREPVQFVQGTKRLLDEGVDVMIEIGAHGVLKSFVETVTDPEQHVVVASLSRKEPEWKTINDALGQLWAAGLAVEWRAYDAAYKRRRVHLPTYPTQHAKSYWLAVDASQMTAVVQSEYTFNDEVAATSTATASVERTPEEWIRLFWKDVLGVSELTAADNFFDLGGDSVNLIQVQSRLNKVFKLNLQMRELFDHPTLGELTARVEALLGVTGQTAERHIPPAPEQEHYPLSHTQRRLWFLYQLDPESTAYNAPVNYAVQGDVDVAQFTRAFQWLVARHSALRTVFRDVDGSPRQVLLDTVGELAYEDLSGLDAATQHERGIGLLRASHQTPFDLEKGPLYRAMLLKIDAEVYHFHFNPHHIITDAWSMEQLVQELAVVYHALLEGQAPPLPPQPVQFVDYAVWHEQQLAAGALVQEEQFWLQTLAQPLPVLELPLDFPRPEVQTSHGDVHSFRLAPAVGRQLRQTAAAHDTSLYMVLMTAYVYLMYELAQETDIIIGTPVLGRTEEALEACFGYFANTIAIRTRMDGVQSLQQLLQQVKQECLAAFEHQSYPFDLLVDKLQVPRDTSRTPVFSTFFVFRNEQVRADAPSPAALTGHQLRFELPQADEGEAVEFFDTAAKFDLTLNIIASGDDMHVMFEYNTDLFRPRTIERFAERLRNVFTALVDQATTPLAELDVQTAEERALYRRLNDTNSAYDVCTIQEKVYRWAAKQPHRLALSAGDVQLTWAELNARSNQLAHTLRERGVAPGTVVLLLLERGVEAILAMLAVLKAGGAYVPVDPDYPAERVRYMVEDSDAQLLLTHSHLLERFAEQAVEQVCVEAVPTDAPTADLELFNTPDDLAYIIYTSGSTGRPKGTELRHRGVLNLAQWKHDEFGYTKLDTVLQFASYSFDASVAEIFPALLNGGHLHVLVGEARQSVEEYAAEVAATQATVAELPTVFFQTMATHLPEEAIHQLATLRVLFVAGEALPGEAVRVWQRRFGARTLLVNAYGPTEATVCATAYAIEGAFPSDVANVPIGTPIANTELYVLDERLKPCPVHVVGELYIGSVGLARSYRHQPERTAESFVTAPFADRLYKTGDLVRLLPTGVIEYVGRKDAQVKIRGHRIEVGEIEDVLVRQPGIDQAAIVAETANERKRLVAYVTMQAGLSLDVDAMRAQLGRHLPDYMLPSYFLELEAMPLTPNGKIDRQRLPAIGDGMTQETFVAPRTAVERRVAAIWQECLRSAELSVHDSFFQIGGDSILSMQVTSRLNQAGFKVRPADLFKYQTIAELARQIEENDLYREGRAHVEEAISGPVPLSHIQRSHVYNPAVDAEFFLMPIVLDIGKKIDVVRLQAVLNKLLTHHDMLRATYRRVGDNVEQVLLAPEAAVLTLDVYQASEAPDDLERELKESIRFEGGLLMRAALVSYADDRHRLYWIMSHLYSDMFSYRLLVQDLIDLYERAEQGLELVLPDKTTSYREWVERAESFVHSAEGADCFRYWQPLLTALAAHDPLPIDDPQGRNQVGDHQSLPLELDEVHTQALKGLTIGAARPSVKEVLLTALTRAVAGWSEREQVAIQVEGHGRDAWDDELDLSRTVGWFTNIYPLVVQLTAAEPVDTTLARVRSTLRELPYEGTPFGMLRYYSREEAVQAAFAAYREPEILFNFHGQFDSAEATTTAWQVGEQQVFNHNLNDEAWFKLLIVGSIRDGRLQLSLHYSQHQYQRTTMEQLCARFHAELMNMIAADEVKA